MYFIGLVVVLWVVLEDFDFLVISEVLYQLIKTSSKFLAPFHVVEEPAPISLFPPPNHHKIRT